MKEQIINGKPVLVFSWDVSDALERETSYRGGRIFHPKDDALWLEKEFPMSLTTASVLLGSLVESAGKDLVMVDNKRSSLADKQWLEHSVGQLIVYDLLSRFLNEAEYYEKAAQLSAAIRSQLWKFLLKPRRIQKYPHEDQKYWGDDYDQRPNLELYLKQPNDATAPD